MDHFNVPLLAESSYVSTAGTTQIPNNITSTSSVISHHNNNNNSNNNNNGTTTTHHHKDHMLAAGSTHHTTPFISYTLDTTSKDTNSIASVIKSSDYATFTSCIQQSALLDQRGSVVDAHLDGVSLGGLCDLKFPSPNPHSSGDTSFRNLTLIQSIEAKTPSPSTPSSANVIGSEATANIVETPVPSFTNLIFGNRDTGAENISIDPKLMQTHIVRTSPTTTTSSVGTATSAAATASSVTTTQYHTLKPLEVITTHYDDRGGGREISAETTTITMRTPPTTVVGNCETNLLNYNNIVSSQTTILTTAATTNTTAANQESKQSINNNSNYILNGLHNRHNHHQHQHQQQQHHIQHQQQQQQQQHDASLVSNSNISNTTNISNMQKLADNHITTTSAMSSLATNNKTNNSNTANQHHNNTTTTIINNNRSTTLHSIDDLAASSCTPSIATLTNSSSNGSNNSNNNNNKVEISQIIDTNSIASTTTTTTTTTNNHNLSNLSSECDDSLSSSQDDNIDLEIDDQNGYQDTTSSHSQQSGGGSAGGGGGSGASSLLNAASAVQLINGGSSGVGGQSNTTASYMSLLPPGSTSVSHLGGTGVGGSGTSVPVGGTSATVSGEAIDFKHLFEELCPVCGDKVSGYHYGLLTCESCKGFFKRTVQNKKVYTCVAERSCHIDKTQRKRCPFCRFQKCLEVGMKLEAVRADRMRGGRNKFGPMYKRDRARKLQVMRQRQLALQALRTSMGTTDMKATPLSPGYQQAYPNMNIKQEIQIPQVSSLTQSPDSSPSPIAIALGQVTGTSTSGGGGVITTPMNGSGGNGGSGNGGGGGNGNSGNNNSSDIINRSSSGGGSGGSSCHDAGSGSLQNSAESKLCFDSGTHPSSTADSLIEPLRVSPMIREFVQSIDDREWQTQLFALLQKQTYNQVEVDLFELMCKVLDQNLFSQVDWARNTVFFKDLKVDDQMKLLQHSWSDMLVLDHLHHRIHNGLPDETQLNNGQVFNLLSLGLLGVPALGDFFNELQNKLQDLKFDMGDYVCMKFLILLNPDVRGIINKKTVLEGHENVQAALLDYTLTCYPSVTDKFRRLLNILPDIHAMASRGEDHLYTKHCAGSAPTQTLLMEMLHAKRKV